MACSKCNGSGLIPLKSRKDGSVVPFAWTFCECHEDIEDYRPPAPEDFDWPMSYSIYRSLCQQHGWPDPGPCEISQLPEEPKPIFKPRPINKEIDQLKSQVLYLQSKVNELQIKRKPKGKY